MKPRKDKFITFRLTQDEEKELELLTLYHRTNKSGLIIKLLSREIARVRKCK